MKHASPTVLEYAILGLIQTEAQSGYAIRKVFETTAMGRYSGSPGAIYPALQRLQQRGLIGKQPLKTTTAAGKPKFGFCCTDHGRAVLTHWLRLPLTPTAIAKHLDVLFLRFAFMERLLAAEEIEAFLRSMRDGLQRHVDDLQAYYDEHSRAMNLHGRLALEHGIRGNQTSLAWAESALLQLQQPAAAPPTTP